jgi:hypothetical protein
LTFLAEVQPTSGERLPAGDREFREWRREVERYGGGVFVTAGEPGAAKRGADGLSPNYRVVLDNQYARAYDIAIPAGTNEPLHTHKDRVVICLTGSAHALMSEGFSPSAPKTSWMTCSRCSALMWFNPP